MFRKIIWDVDGTIADLTISSYAELYRYLVSANTGFQMSKP